MTTQLLGHRFKFWVLLQELDKAVSDFDEVPAEWVTVWTGRVNIIPASSQESVRGQQIEDDTTHAVEMRYNPDQPVTSAMRFLIDDQALADENKRSLHISSVINSDERKQFLLLQCVETS